MLLIAVID